MHGGEDKEENNVVLKEWKPKSGYLCNVSWQQQFRKNGKERENVFPHSCGFC